MDYCCDNQNIVNDRGMNVCISCASIISYDMVDGWSSKNLYYRKSIHSRRRWFYNKVVKYVEAKNIGILVNDFLEVVDVIQKYNLLKGRNISQYSYYIIRLASRRGIELKVDIPDMKTPHIKKVFDDRLFGKIYPLLGWDINCECIYYMSLKNHLKK